MRHCDLPNHRTLIREEKNANYPTDDAGGFVNAKWPGHADWPAALRPLTPPPPGQGQVRGAHKKKASHVVANHFRQVG